MDDETKEALEMLGTGYDHPAIEIEQERTVIQRRGGKLEAIDKPAFVKISTAFKQELPIISGDALKVWLFISLSINRKTGKANPGLRTISAGVKLAVNTVQKCLRELEALQLLEVDRDSARYNIYESPEYVSANRSDPTVSNGDTVCETVSNPLLTVSNFVETVSPSVILNQINQNNQSCTQKKPDILDGVLDQERQALSRKDTAWANREKFPEMLRPLADLCVRKFGAPQKRDLILWLQEIGHWYDSGCLPADFAQAEQIAAKYETPPLSPTGLTKAIKLAAQNRKAAKEKPPVGLAEDDWRRKLKL